MKEVMAIIRSNQWERTKKKLVELGVNSYTTCRVSGRGRQKGLRYLSRQGGTMGMHFMPKRLVWFWLHEEEVEKVIKGIMEVNRTGQIGDGKIFVCPTDDALRIRTGDRGELALI